MARPSSNDPLDRFRWTVEIEGFQRIGFTVCGVPSLVYNTKKYPEGGAHLFPRKIIDSVEYRPVVLERGVTADTSFSGWAQQPQELIRGRAEKVTAEIPGTGGFATSFSDLTGSDQAITGNFPLEYRREVIINHLNRTGEVVKVYKLINAIPVEFVAASEFRSDGDDVLSMERLVLEYESFEIISNNINTNPADVRDVFKRATRNLF